MKRVLWFLLGLCTTAACVVHFTPAVTPQKIPPVSPRIRARALLLITPSFEAYLSREKNGVQQVFHYGEAGAKALSALVTESFAVVEIRRVAADVQPLIAGPADTSVADILLVPSFHSARARLRLTEGDRTYIRSAYVDSLQLGSAMPGDMSASVTLRLNARPFGTGHTSTR